MHTLLIIGWAVWAYASMHAIYIVIGHAGLTRMFPEGKRWWDSWVELGALTNFAVMVLCNPWGWK
jgi:hypothetical protein